MTILSALVILSTSKTSSSLINTSKKASPMRTFLGNRRRNRLPTVLKHAANSLDGGYVMCGILAMVTRSSCGIQRQRPAFFYEDDEVVVITSERPVLNCLQRQHRGGARNSTGTRVIIKRDGTVSMPQVKQPGERKAAVSAHLLQPRQRPRHLHRTQRARSSTRPQIMEAVEHDLDLAVTSFIPNTAKPASTVWSKALKTT